MRCRWHWGLPVAAAAAALAVLGRPALAPGADDGQPAPPETVPVSPAQWAAAEAPYSDQLPPGEEVVARQKWRPRDFVVYVDQNKEDHYEVLFSIVAHLRNASAVPHSRALPVPRGSRARVRIHVNPTFLGIRRKALLKRVDSSIFYSQPWRFDLRITVTFYPRRTELCNWCFPDAVELAERRGSPSEVLLSHLVPNGTELAEWPNVWYVTPLGRPYLLPTHFPFPRAPRFPPPPGAPVAFLVQGRLVGGRRNYAALAGALEEHAGRRGRRFVLRMVGRLTQAGFPPALDPWLRRRVIELVKDPDDVEFHSAVSRCHVILPLVDESFSHEYFSSKLTSSVTYGLGFQMRFVAHRRLQQIYSLPAEGHWWYDSADGFAGAFAAALDAAERGAQQQ